MAERLTAPDSAGGQSLDSATFRSAIEAYLAAYAWRAAARMDDLRLKAPSQSLNPLRTPFDALLSQESLGLRRGFADAVQDGAGLLFARDVLVIGDDPAVQSSPLEPSQAPRVSPLLSSLNVEYDYTGVSSLPEKWETGAPGAFGSRYRVIAMEATALPAGFTARLERWLRERPERRLVLIGALPTRMLASERF